MRALIPAAAAAALLASPASARDLEFSWGKPGISFDQYRGDAVSCASEGYYLDVSHTDAAKLFRAASGQLDAMAPMGVPMVDGTSPLMNPLLSEGLKADPDAARSADYGTRQAQIVAATRPEKRMKEVGQLMTLTIERCLAGLGYHRFRLTHDQQRALRKFKRGTLERRAYLYSLATNPAVLHDQAG
jgi:hypothetical protein